MPSDPAPTIPALPRPARWGAGAVAIRLLRFLAFGLPARLLRAAFLPDAANIADLSDHQLADVGVQRSDLLRRGWGGAADAEIAARLGSGRDRSGR